MGKKTFITPSMKQVWTVSAVYLTQIGMGLAVSYPSSLLPALRDPDSTIKVDLHTASWLVSSVGFSTCLGQFPCSFFMHHYGRRIANGLSLIPAISGWFLIYFSFNVTELMIGRILTGITIGGCSFLGALVIGEYTSPEYRGVFLNLKAAFFSIGCMLGHILANCLFWRTIALIALIPNILAALITWTWPESPAWLASRKQFERCEQAFVWLRGKDEFAVKELDELIKAQINQTSDYLTKLSLLDKIVEFFKKFTRKDFLKPMFIVFVTQNLMELSGRHVFPAYASDIIGDITGNRFHSFYCILGLDIVVTASNLFSSVLAKYMTRRSLLFGTGWTAVAVLAIFCAYLLIMPVEIRNNEMYKFWLPISLLVVYFIFACLGCHPIPLGIFGEVMPLAHRASGSVWTGISFSLSMYGTLQIAPYLLFSIKVGGTFAVLGTGMAVCLLILYFVLPETKDRTLQEIDNFFTYGHYTVDRVDDELKEEKIKMLDNNLTSA